MSSLQPVHATWHHVRNDDHLVAACASKTTTVENTAPVAARAPAWKTQAQGFERGIGGKRDYRAAVQVYQHTCDDGRGDLDASRALVDAAVHGRGVIATPEALQQLAGAMCDRGSKESCAIAVIAQARPGTKLETTEALRAQCTSGNVDACRALPLTHGGSFSGGAEARAEADNELACAHGAREYCDLIVQDVIHCDATASVADGAPCLAWRDAHPDALYHDKLALVEKVFGQLTSDCDAGDALACDLVPGRKISELERCEAGDYDQCRKAGYGGRAGIVACAGGVKATCAASGSASP